MSSVSSTVSEALAAFVAGRLRAARVVSVVSEAYYATAEGGKRDALRPLMDVIERAAPGTAELASTPGGTGFDVRLAERGFPRQYEADLKRAAEQVLGSGWVREPAATVDSAPRTGFLGGILARVRRLF